MIQKCKAKAPYRYGIRAIKRSDLKLPAKSAAAADTLLVKAATAEIKEPVTEPVKPEPTVKTEVKAEVKSEPKIEAPVEAKVEPKAEAKVEPKPAEDVKPAAKGAELTAAGFSARSVQLLVGAKIETVEQLTAYLDSGKSLEDLPKVGKNSAANIQEELNAWITKTSDPS